MHHSINNITPAMLFIISIYTHMQIYAKLGLFFLIYIIIKYQSCDLFPGTIPNGRRQRFCRMTQKQFMLSIAFGLFLFFLFNVVMKK